MRENFMMTGIPQISPLPAIPPKGPEEGFEKQDHHYLKEQPMSIAKTIFKYAAQQVVKDAKALAAEAKSAARDALGGDEGLAALKKDAQSVLRAGASDLRRGALSVAAAAITIVNDTVADVQGKAEKNLEAAFAKAGVKTQEEPVTPAKKAPAKKAARKSAPKKAVKKRKAPAA
jgi:hypothetical protein